MEEKLSICAAIETHIKRKKLQKIGDKNFGKWNWNNNMQYCDKGRRIMIGWNDVNVIVNIVHAATQSMLCHVGTIKGDLKMYYGFVYATNSGNERKMLWKDLEIYKRIVGNNAWVVLGYMNVTLDPKKHSIGSSSMTRDINEFKDCVKINELEDISSSGLFFTWTKNLHKVKSDHCPTVLAIPNVKEGYNGCHMFKTVKKLKGLKGDMKKLAWKNMDVFENVVNLRDKLKNVQAKIDKDPHEKKLREEESVVLKEYVEAMKFKEKLLNHKNKINCIQDDQGNKYEGENVANQFVRHFHKFIGESFLIKDGTFINALISKRLSDEDAYNMVNLRRPTLDSREEQALEERVRVGLGWVTGDGGLMRDERDEGVEGCAVGYV
ncbi:RNA-directed DNA polymerase, eukaryota, reverse transcriptase zinc-binding domain protein [Tanacetum coccineum]